LITATLLTARLAPLHWLDTVVIVIYFASVLGLGILLQRQTHTSEDFFLAGREMSAWVAGVSFLAANMGALELMGWAASAYQYGFLAAHWYWIGAVPAMLFLALVMMPFYYISKTHSVPGYLKLRFGEPTRALSAISFAGMTVLMSGINMFAMAKVMGVVLGWNLHFSILISSITVAAYVTLGGLRSAILNEVLQFFLIWAGALVVPVVGLMETGGWSGLKARIVANTASHGYLHLWTTLGDFRANSMGVHWTGIVFGLGFVGALGYWTTDFLVVQRILAAKDLRSAQMAPIIGAWFKMAVPFIVIVPGLIGLAVLPQAGLSLVAEGTARAGQHTYNEVLPLLLIRYAGPGLLGLGITALIAGFMSGMAGNVSAFSAVWTYDIYQPLLRRGKQTDAELLRMGRWSTPIGVIMSIGTAYLAMHFASIMEYVQALFSFFVTPLFGTVILGMLWKRATGPGAFWGLLTGTGSSIGMWAWVQAQPSALKILALSPYAQPMAESLYRMLWSWLACMVVTVTVSLATRPIPYERLAGLVYGCTAMPERGQYPLVQRPVFWAGAAGFVFLWVQWMFR